MNNNTPSTQKNPALDTRLAALKANVHAVEHRLKQTFATYDAAFAKLNTQLAHTNTTLNTLQADADDAVDASVTLIKHQMLKELEAEEQTKVPQDQDNG